MRVLIRFLLSSLSVALSAAMVFGGSTGKIAGKVVDRKTNEPLPGANISINGTSLGATTNVEGNYTILNVPPGTYTVTASFVGYRRMQVKDIGVSTDFTTQLNFQLEEGDIQMDVTIVQGERQPLVRKDLTNPVSSLSTETLNELPLTDINKAIGLQAGITVDDDGAIHIRGGYSNEVAYTVNGINVNNPYGNTRSIGLATNAVQEVSVSSGTFSAEYGTALSGVVNYITKEGGRKWTGGMRYMTGDYYTNRTSLFPNLNKYRMTAVNRTEVSLGGPLLENLSFYGSGVYDWFGGSRFATRLYMPEDSYLSREGFASTDKRRGAASSAYYFGPLNHDTSDLTGGATGDGATVPLNWSQSYNIQGNLSYRLTSNARIKYEFVYTNGLSPSSTSYSYRFKPDGRAISKTHSAFHSIDWTHTLSDKFFYTLKGSYIIDAGTSRTFDAWDDPRYLPSFYSRVLPNTKYLVGGVDLDRFERRTETIGVKFDMVAQTGVHELKVGAEARTFKLFVESYTLMFRDPNNPALEASFTNVLTKGAVFKQYIPDKSGGYTNYTRYPYQLSAYVQDKVELSQSIVLNVGLRYDRFLSASQYNSHISADLVQNTGATFLDANLTEADVKEMVSPRVSFSFPITDQGTIRFSYGHFYQIGSLSSLYSNINFRNPAGSPSFGNANVDPQRSVQYELGLQQGLTDNIKVDVTAYYKDVRDYIYSQLIYTPRGDQSYYLLTNLSYANTRGLSIALLKRRDPSSMITASVDYTFQIAEGNRTEPADEIFFNEQNGKLSETYLVPMGFDRSHTLTTTVMLSEPKNWTASLIGYVRTGTPYTPSFPSNVVPITFVQNSDRQPVQWNIDVKLEKYFTLDWLDFSVYVQVDNIFDVENENYVWANSGRALYNLLEKTNPTLFADLRTRIKRGDPGMIPVSAIDDYYADPSNVNSPRLVRFGVSLLF